MNETPKIILLKTRVYTDIRSCVIIMLIIFRCLTNANNIILSLENITNIPKYYYSIKVSNIYREYNNATQEYYIIL